MSLWHRRSTRRNGTTEEAEDSTQEGAHDMTEEDLQPRDASEMPREPQNPVNPNPEAAT